MLNFLVSTDLDGTLLDHFSYDWQAAKPSLQRLAALSIPVVINTSKTFEEVLLLQQSMDLQEPFIVENGSALYLPQAGYCQPPEATARGEYWQITLGCTRNKIVRLVESLREQQQCRFQSFSNMSVDDVILHTGLSTEGAKLALLRGFSEPLVWQDDDEKYQTFIRAVENEKLRVIKGGRFVHILGNTDKGKAITWYKNYLQHEKKETISLIALGDSPNDIDMLNIAEFPVLVKSPTHDYPELNTAAAIYRTEGFGPVGWHEAIEHLINTDKNQG